MNEIEVINKFSWIYGQDSCAMGGLVGQVTHCRYNEIEFYTRENTTGISSFEIGSGERWGDKRGAVPRRERQVLELLVDPAHWEEISQLVKKADPMHRTAVKNQRFTLQWIKANQ